MITRWIEKGLIKMLTSEGGLNLSDIDASNKKIDMGFYSLKCVFFSSKHWLAAGLLRKFFGYRLVWLKWHFYHNNEFTT